jgi:ARG/rhodanese/phosphatase superfamily protein
MSFQLPQLQIGQPLACNSLTVFPLYAEAGKPAEYQLADEAIAASTVAVQEVSDGGSVPELLVENTGDCRVLFLEGEELRGAKQNRVLNTSILVPAKSKIKVPVSCVEQGRWRHTSRHFASGKSRSPHGLHYKLKASVSESLKREASHRSDQGAVWEEVEKKQVAFGYASKTMAMADTYDNLADKMTEYREKLKYPEGAVGVAVAVGPRVVCVDVFDKPATCQKAWDRLLSGCIVDALEGTAPQGQADAKVVEQVLGESKTTIWTEAPAVGEGQEFRAEFDGSVGSALMLEEAVVHVNVLTAPA